MFQLFGALMVAAAAAVQSGDATVLNDVKQLMGGKPPRAVRVIVGGSKYEPAESPSDRKHARIDRVTQVLDPSVESSAFWTTPHGFLIAAESRTPAMTTDKLMGTEYRVISVPMPDGRVIRGYVNDQNVLERVRTEIPNAGRSASAKASANRGNIAFEAVFLSWVDFGGFKYPTLVVHKEDNEVARILVIEKAERLDAPQG